MGRLDQIADVVGTSGARPSGRNVSRLSAVPSQRSRNVTRLDEVRSAAADWAGSGGGGSQGGNWLTRLGANVLSNPVARTLLAPLEVAAVPQRVVASGIQELSDLVAGRGASWDDFTDQVSDPTFGMGTVLAGPDGEITGNKWLDRAIGFVGDVATDPLTYLTLGTGTFASRAGRGALATRLAAEGAAEDLVARAGRRGLAGFRDAERAALNLPRSGVRFAGQRIAGTAGLADAVGTRLSAVRDIYNQTRVADTLRRARVDEDLLEAVTKLATGRGAMEATEAAAQIGAVRRGNSAGARLSNEVGREAKELSGEIDDQTRRTGVLALEEGNTSNPVLARVRAWFDSIVGPNGSGRLNEEYGANIPYRQNYVPHIWTDTGRELVDSGDELGADLRRILGITTDKISGSQIAEGRVLVGGKHTIGGRQVDFGRGTIGEINMEMRRVFGDVIGDVDVLESDLVRIMDRYVNFSGQAAREAAVKRSLVDDFGVASNTADRMVTEVAKRESVEAFRDADRSLVSRLNPLTKSQRQAEAKVNSKIDAVIGRYRKRNAARLAALGDAATDEAGRVGIDLNNMAERLRDPARRQGALDTLEKAVADLDVVLDDIGREVVDAEQAARQGRRNNRRALINRRKRLQQEREELSSVLGELRDITIEIGEDGVQVPVVLYDEPARVRDSSVATQRTLEGLPPAQNDRYNPSRVRAIADRVEAAPKAGEVSVELGPADMAAAQRRRDELLAQLEEMGVAERVAGPVRDGEAPLYDIRASKLDNYERLDAGLVVVNGAEIRDVEFELLRQSGAVVDTRLRQVVSDLRQWTEVRDNLQQIAESARRYIDEERAIPKGRKAAQSWRERQQFVEGVLRLIEPENAAERVVVQQLRFGYGENAPATLAAAVRAGVGTPEGDLTYGILVDYYRLESELLDLTQQVDAVRLDRVRLDAGRRAASQGDWDTANQILEMVTDGDFHVVFRSMIEDGWKEISERLGVAVPDRMLSMLEALPQTRREMSALMKMWDRYIQFFKTYATLSPRFHVRNMMSAVFMNAAHGVSVDSMNAGFKLWNRYMNDPRVYRSLSPSEKQVIDAVLASGAGQFDELGRAAVGGRLTQNRVTNASYKAGQYVEGWVRAGMAWDSIVARNNGIDEAIARIEFVHFIYSDSSKLDQQARRLVPFWTFFSRNIPMQIQTMWTKPRMYQLYNQTMKNISADEEGDVVPYYLKDQGAVKLPFGDNLYLAPDIGFNRLREDLEKLTPEGFPRLASDTIAPLRLAIEGLAGERLYTGQPFNDDRAVPVSGAKWALLPLMALLGGVTEDESGRLAYTDFANYATESLVPTLGQLERLFPQEERNQQRRATNVLGFLTGAPVRQVTRRDIESELYRRGLAERP